MIEVMDAGLAVAQGPAALPDGAALRAIEAAQVGPTLQQALAQGGGCGCASRGTAGAAAILDAPMAAILLPETLLEDHEPEYRRSLDGIGVRQTALWLVAPEAELLFDAPAPAYGGKTVGPQATTLSSGGTPGDANGNGIPDDEEEIIIPGERPRDMDEGGGDAGGGSLGYGVDPLLGEGNGTGGGGGGGSLEGTEQQSHEDCKKDSKAKEVTNTINGSTQDGKERGAIIYKDANGNVVSTPIAVGEPGTVSVTLPEGVTMSQIIGYVHSHPLAPRSDDAGEDAIYDSADVYPSPADWDQMDAMVAGGANPASLSFYVIDRHGAVREYNYSDKSIYDVPEDQLLGRDGQTPPPVPAPMSEGGSCE